MKIKRLWSLGLCFCLAPLVACSDDDTATIGIDGGVGDGGVDGAIADAPVAACLTGGSGQVVLAPTAPVALTPLARLVGAVGSTPLDLSGSMPVTVPAGPYVLEHKRVMVAPGPGELIGRAYYVSTIGFDGCVRADVTNTIALTYTLEPGSGKLWTTPANGAGAVVAFDEAQLRADAAATPTVVRKLGVTAVGDIAFDLHGNLWVSDRGVGGGLVAYAVNTLGIAADRAPSFKVPGYESIVALAFDDSGSLWAAQGVAGQPADRLLKWTEAALEFDLAATTTATRTVPHSLELTSAELKLPSDMAFDTAGNLWVVSGEKDQVVMFTPAQLLVGGNVAPTVVLKARRATGPILGPYQRPNGLSFDATGNLWVGWSEVLRFAPAQLVATATIDDPHRLLPQGSGGAGVSVSAQAFDALGGLWLSRTNVGTTPAALVRVLPAGLTAGGEQAPGNTLSSAGLGNGVSSIVLNPAPMGLPIRD